MTLSLETVYETLKNCDVVSTQDELGLFINRSKSYFSSSIARNRAIGYETLHRFFWQIHDVYISTLAAMAEENSLEQKQAYDEGITEIENLLGLIQDEMDRRIGR